MEVCLGFDTSCYTTSAAAVSMHGEVLASSRMLLPVAVGQRGLRQSEAVFAHIKQMPLVAQDLRKMLHPDDRIVCVCASARPCEDSESYMPVFTVGAGHAKVLASTLNVPLYETTHQRGHVAAGMLGQQFDDKILALHLSGGTTELMLWDGQRIELIGGSLDLHAGQMVDRIGVRLGLGFPAGPALETLALENAEPTEALLPVSMDKDDCCCHLSGAETKALALINSGNYSPERIAAEVYDLLARTVARMLAAGCKRRGVRQTLVVGGVASSGLLRSLIASRLAKQRHPVELCLGAKEYSGDNAVGVATIGMQEYRMQNNF